MFEGKTNFEYVQGDDGSWNAVLRGGITIAGAGPTQEDAVNQLVGYLRDIVNERNDQLKAIGNVISPSFPSFYKGPSDVEIAITEKAVSEH